MLDYIFIKHINWLNFFAEEKKKNSTHFVIIGDININLIWIENVYYVC